MMKNVAQNCIFFGCCWQSTNYAQFVNDDYVEKDWFFVSSKKKKKIQPTLKLPAV